MLNLLEISAFLLLLSAVFGWLNVVFIRLPNTIGMLVLALAASASLIVFDMIVPSSNLKEAVAATVAQIDFFEALMNGMLAFLLFAGALHVDLGLLRERKWIIGSMATFGVVLSTMIVGAGFWLAARAFGLEMPFIWALVFGALISPTDPVAVLSLLKSVHLPENLEVKIAGESLFNDGVGVVVFTILLALAAGDVSFDLVHVGEIFLTEAVGGALIGLVAGFVTMHAMRAIDDYSVEILVTLALVTALYAIAQRLHMSGPIAVVVAGLLIGNSGAKTAMSEQTRAYLFQFWRIVDELLNSVLFLLIGLEVLVIAIDPSMAGLAMVSVPLVLAARFFAVAAPITLLSLRKTFARGSIPVLTWGGVRGGISVALALSLPLVPQKPPIIVATYLVVIFSIIVQGLTIRSLVRRVVFT